MDWSSRGKFLVDLATKTCAENKYFTKNKENAVADPIPNNNAVDIMDSNQNSEYESTVDNTDADVTWNPPDHNLNSDSDCNNQTRNQENAVADPIPNNNAVDIRDSNQSSESESTVDDSDADVTWNPPAPDHNLNSDSDCSNQNDVEDNEDNNTTEDEPKRCKERKLQRDSWKRNESKRLRNSGKEYVNVKGVVVPSRAMKAPCGVKCQFECSKKLSEESRFSIFTSFWEIGDITRQRCYIQNCMTTIKPKYRYQKLDSSRKLNNAFHFEVNSDRVRVCKLMFMNTLNIGDRFVRSVIKKNNDGIIEIDKRGKHLNHRTLDNSIKDDIRAHINKFSRIESHYLRAQTSREFIDGGLTIASMHRMYAEECTNENKQAGNITLYSKIFNEEFNIGFFVPKKDQCTLCNSFQNASEEEKQALKEDFEKHIRLKMSSRAEKEEDAKKAKNGDIILACFDLQAVLPTPCGEISVFYYKRRLSSYNFTIFNVGNQNGYCYFWNESVAHRGANETGSCIDKFLSQHSQGKEVIFFSDNCVGQNKNKFIVSMYMHAVQKYNIPSITHKFFAVGHGQNDGDSMHSVIEKQKKRILRSGPIFLPAQWVTVIQSSKKSGSPYHVTEMETEDIKDLKELSQQIGSNFVSDENGNKVKWNELKIIRVVKEIPFSFQYKYTYDEIELFKTVFVRRNTRGSSNLEMKSAYSSPPKISDQKRNDLISLCESNAIPKNYHNFYYNL